MKRFLLIDDHFVVRSGIKGLLEILFKPAEVFEAADSDAAVLKLKERSYDLIMMDVNVPNNDMLGLMDYIHTAYPEARVLIFSMSPEQVYARRFLRAGAKGFLSKDASAEETARAIQLVLNNRRYISDTLAQLLAEESLGDAPSNPFEKLSPREFEIAMMLLKGQLISEIARLLHLQPSTVGTHKAKLFKKMNVANLMQLKELAASYIQQ